MRKIPDNLTVRKTKVKNGRWPPAWCLALIVGVNVASYLFIYWMI